MCVIMRSPVLALAAIGSFLACQMLCLDARGKQRVFSSHDSRTAEYAGFDPCCGGTKQVPANSPDGPDCCLTCCCSGAVVSQSVTLDHLAFEIILTLPWPIPIDDLEVAHSATNLLISLRPPEPSLRTTVLLI